MANGVLATANTRAAHIQGVTAAVASGTANFGGIGKGTSGATVGAPSGFLPSPATIAWNNAAGVASTVPLVAVTRRYQIQFALGLTTQEKLIPTKYMASQLAIEITLETPADCIVADFDTAASGVAGYVGLGSILNYQVYNVNLIPEILEFDASYDTAFLQGLQNGGVPIKFCSWLIFFITIGIHFFSHLPIRQTSIC